MNVLRAPSFFRPASRSSSPAPVPQPPSRHDSGNSLESVPRSLNKLSLSNFRRPARSTGPAANPPPLVQDCSYLEVLNLKLSEAVSKALLLPVSPGNLAEQVAGRKPIPEGRGHALGALIASELHATRDNPHLHRAILRSLHRPLSVLLNNFSSQLLPIISSPQFLSVPVLTPHSPNLNAVQVHALSIAAFAGDILDTFDELGLGLDNDIRGDGLKEIREGLTSIIGRVIQPMLANLKNELVPLLDALESPRSLRSPGFKLSIHPSIVTLQTLIPVYSRAIGRYMTSGACDTMLATFLISVVWRGVVALAHRPFPTTSPSPTLLPVGSKKLKGPPTGTPPVTPPPSRFMKLPPSRPPSPVLDTYADPTASDARALYDLLSTLPRPAGKKGTSLAKEAVDDAFDGLKSLAPFLEAVYASKSGIFHGQNASTNLDNLTAEIPLLVALPILLRVLHQPMTVHQILGLSEEDYRRGCLTGFGRAEECALAVGQRVNDVLYIRPEVPLVMLQWLDMELAEITNAG